MNQPVEGYAAWGRHIWQLMVPNLPIPTSAMGEAGGGLNLLTSAIDTRAGSQMREALINLGLDSTDMTHTGYNGVGIAKTATTQAAQALFGIGVNRADDLWEANQRLRELKGKALEEKAKARREITPSLPIMGDNPKIEALVEKRVEEYRTFVEKEIVPRAETQQKARATIEEMRERRQRARAALGLPRP